MSDDTTSAESAESPDTTSAKAASSTQAGDDGPSMTAARYADGSITYPPHPLGPDGQEPVGTVDLSDYTAEVVTWTTSTATPPGVREPNSLAIVEFDVDGEPVRAIGQLTTDEVDIGDAVRPVYCDELRDPDAGIRERESQEWDGFRFQPL
jgi:hypothetical protein